MPEDRVNRQIFIIITHLYRDYSRGKHFLDNLVPVLIASFIISLDRLHGAFHENIFCNKMSYRFKIDPVSFSACTL